MTDAIDIRDIETSDEIAACYPVLLQLRPQLVRERFVDQILRQYQQGYRLSAAFQNGKVVGAVGYRPEESLFYGKFVYVDDLVVDENCRSGGLGAKLLSVARNYAIKCDCQNFVLDTGLHKALAQRFYFRQGLLASSMGFSETLRHGV